MKTEYTKPRDPVTDEEAIRASMVETITPERFDGTLTCCMCGLEHGLWIARVSGSGPAADCRTILTHMFILNGFKSVEDPSVVGVVCKTCTAKSPADVTETTGEPAAKPEEAAL